MEMTDRRLINTAAKSRSSSSFSTIEEGNCRGSSWCNDKSMPRHKNGGANNTNDKLMGVSRMKRFHMALYLTAAISFYHLISKGHSMLDPEEGAHVMKKNETEPIDFGINSNILTVSESETTPPFSIFHENNTTYPNSLPITEETHSPSSELTRPDVDNHSLTSADLNSSDEISDGTQGILETNGEEENIEVGVKGNSSNNESFGESQEGSKNETTNSTSLTATMESENEIKEDFDEVDDVMSDIFKKENRTVEISYMESKNETQPIDTASTIPLSSSPTEGSIDLPPIKNSTTTKSVSTGGISNQIRNTISDSDLLPVALKFAETHCDLTNVKDGAWYPSGPDNDWQQRAPYVIVAGGWNTGVNPLANALLRHPQIDAAKQNNFFLPKNFDGRFSIKTNDRNVNSNNQTTGTESIFNVKVFPARERMYASHYSKATLREKTVSNDEEQTPTTEVAGENDENIDSKTRHVAMDVSPGLIFHAHETAHWILCTAPWVKVVVLLRNPIDRLYRQWIYSVTRLNLKKSFEDWIAPEMKLMQSVGMIDGGDEPSGAEADPKTIVSEREAWRNYRSKRNLVQAIGRSLYVLQLEELIQTYISAGKTPSEEIIILTTEDIEDNTEQAYAELIKFLELTPDDNPKNIGNVTADSNSLALKKALAQKPDTDPMSDETRRMLHEFFKPYDRRLTELLTSNGFEGDWDKRWE